MDLHSWCQHSQNFPQAKPSDGRPRVRASGAFLNEPRVDGEASQTAMIHCRGESRGSGGGGGEGEAAKTRAAKDR